MDAKDAISYIRDALDEVAQTGQKFVSISAFREYLNSLEEAVPESPETQKLRHESSLAHYRAIHETNLEMFKSVLESGRTALTSCNLINGGAAVALLAYIGNMLAKNPKTELDFSLGLGLVSFTSGVLLGGIATGTRYLSQASWSNDWNRCGLSFNIASIVLVLAAYVAFSSGVFFAYSAFGLDAH